MYIKIDLCSVLLMYQERHEIVTKMHHLRSKLNFSSGGGPPYPPKGGAVSTPGPTPSALRVSFRHLRGVHCHCSTFYHLPPEHQYLPPAFQLWTSLQCLPEMVKVLILIEAKYMYTSKFKI